MTKMRENEEFRQKEREKDREKIANDNYMKNNDFGLLIAQYTIWPFQGHYVEDFYYRVEFQHRGSPHNHMVMWLAKSPIYEKENSKSKDECEQFLDKLNSCTRWIAAT